MRNSIKLRARLASTRDDSLSFEINRRTRYWLKIMPMSGRWLSHIRIMPHHREEGSQKICIACFRVQGAIDNDGITQYKIQLLLQVRIVAIHHPVWVVVIAIGRVR